MFQCLKPFECQGIHLVHIIATEMQFIQALEANKSASDYLRETVVDQFEAQNITSPTESLRDNGNESWNRQNLWLLGCISFKLLKPPKAQLKIL